VTGFDYSATARRPHYTDLPAEVRGAIARTLGGSPDEVRLAGGGFTPGFAATLRRGPSSLFVKAASDADPFPFADYQRESVILASMPEGLPVPRLLSARTVLQPERTWTVLCIEHIDGHMPGHPWTTADVGAVEDSLIELDQGLAGLPADLPADLATASFTAGLSDFTAGLTDDDAVLGIFERCATGAVDVPFLPRVTRERWVHLQALVASAPSLLAGSRIVHNDLRPDNIIIERRSGRAYVCDWNFLARGPSWSDWVGLLPYVRHAALDADTWLRSSRLSATADPAAVDAWLAVLAAYMTVRGLSPEIPSSPFLRAHARFTPGIMIDWLFERRKWAA